MTALQTPLQQIASNGTGLSRGPPTCRPTKRIAAPAWKASSNVKFPKSRSLLPKKDDKGKTRPENLPSSANLDLPHDLRLTPMPSSSFRLSRRTHKNIVSPMIPLGNQDRQAKPSSMVLPIMPEF